MFNGSGKSEIFKYKSRQTELLSILK